MLKAMLAAVFSFCSRLNFARLQVRQDPGRSIYPPDTTTVRKEGRKNALPPYNLTGWMRFFAAIDLACGFHFITAGTFRSVPLRALYTY